MKVLITGSNGFIARNLNEYLSKDYEITLRNSKELNLLESEAVETFLKSNSFDIVIHTATYDAAPKHSVKDPNKVLENNLKMFFNITRCNQHFKKMIYFGSGAEFSRPNWKSKMGEDYFDQFIPQDQYGFSKYIMAKHTLSQHNIFNLRLFGVYGKNDDWRTRFISNIIARLILNAPIEMMQNRYFDHLYINDLSRIVKWFIENDPKHKVYNVCSGETVDFKTIAEKLIEISGKNVSLKIHKEGLGDEYSGDNTLLLTELEGFKLTPIEQGLTELYEWQNQNQQLLDKNLLNNF